MKIKPGFGVYGFIVIFLKHSVDGGSGGKGNNEVGFEFEFAAFIKALHSSVLCSLLNLLVSVSFFG